MTAGRGADQNYAEVLEICLQQIAAGEPLEAVVARHPHYARRLRIDLAIAAWLHERADVFSPPVLRLARIRAKVLRQIQPAAAPPRFGLAEFFRWLQGNRLAFQALSVLLILVLLLGSFSGAALAAQGSLPGESLYPVKTAVEDLRLLAVFDPVNDAGLNLDFAGIRVDEMTLLVAKNRSAYLEIPSRRYEQQVDRALLELAQVSESRNGRQIQRAQELARSLPERLEAHARQLEGLANQVSGAGHQALVQTRNFARQRQAASRQLLIKLDQAPLPAHTATATASSQPGSAGPVESGQPAPALASPTAISAAATLLARTASPTLLSPFGPTSTSWLPAGLPSPSATSLRPIGTPSPTSTRWPTQKPISPSNTPTATLRPPSSTPTATPRPPSSTPSETLRPPNSTPTATETPPEQPTKKPSNTPRPTNTHRPTPQPTNPNRP